MSEQQLYGTLLKTILQTPHRDLLGSYPTHQRGINEMSVFYSHLAPWYFKHGKIRDHKELFLASLTMSNESWLRDIGCELLMQLPPYQVERVFNFVTETRENGKRAGRFYNLPRCLRTQGGLYMESLQGNRRRLDGALGTSKSMIKRLFVGLSHPPNEYAQAVLFDNDPPEGSLFWAVKRLQHMVDKGATTIEQAKLIVEHNMPVSIISSIVDVKSPTLMAAQVNNSTPAQVMNNLGSYKHRGAFNHPTLKKLINGKMKKAGTDKRVSAGKIQMAQKIVSDDRELSQTMDKATETRVRSGRRITRSTGLFIDKSSSMDNAVAMGLQLVPIIKANSDGPITIVAFDNVALPIVPRDDSLASAKVAMRGIIANGMTAFGAPIEHLIRKGIEVEQVVFICDQWETDAPGFERSMRKYEKKFGTMPEVIVIYLNNGGRNARDIETACKTLGIECQVLDYTNADYYGFEDLLTLLTYPSMTELAGEVLDYPLPSTGRFN